MPNLAICVFSCDTDPSGQVVVNFSASVPDGSPSVEGQVAVDFQNSVPSVNAAIETAAKAAHSAAFGTTFGGADKVFLFGGRVS